jgi:hypothetical protein
MPPFGLSPNYSLSIPLKPQSLKNNVCRAPFTLFLSGYHEDMEINNTVNAFSII